MVGFGVSGMNGHKVLFDSGIKEGLGVVQTLESPGIGLNPDHFEAPCRDRFVGNLGGDASGEAACMAEDDLEGEFYVRMLFNWRPIPFENAEPNGWLAWRTFEAAVLANATDPAEHAKLTEEAAERQGEGNLAAGSTATDAWKDVLTGRGRL